jgi:hypothetical protein
MKLAALISPALLLAVTQAYAGGVVVTCGGGALDAITKKKPNLAELILKLKEKKAAAGAFSSGKTSIKLDSFSDDYGNTELASQYLENFSSEGGVFSFEVTDSNPNAAPQVGDRRYAFSGIQGCDDPESSSGRVKLSIYQKGIIGWVPGPSADCRCALTAK